MKNILGMDAAIRDGYKFIKWLHLGAEEKEYLHSVGLSEEYIETITKDDIETEKIHLKNYGLSPSVLKDGLNFPSFQQTILFTGYIFSVCPECGKTLASNASFCVFTDGYNQHMYYHFQCCKQFFLIIGRSPQSKLGIYLPEFEVIVSFMYYGNEYYAYPNNENYGQKNFQTWINTFKDYTKHFRKM